MMSIRGVGDGAGDWLAVSVADNVAIRDGSGVGVAVGGTVDKGVGKGERGSVADATISMVQVAGGEMQPYGTSIA
jgi:hypothetical protein